ncbi:MAG: aldo/keto reductase [Propionibacteriaceae bacterium]|nr:aldo/keto reductase [Propionibacteriaceae bacterium]
MEHITLGASGLRVSAIIMGCMSFGESGRGAHEWSLPEDISRGIIRTALDAGITTFDTADVYSDGSSEEIVGRALKDFARREELVIATKVNGRMYPGPHGQGLSRAHIMTAIDASLTRLGTDYVDLYQIHRFDPTVPVEETMEALNDIVRAGKARYIGASSMYAWQFAKMQYTADLGGWTRFISMQDQYSLLMREEEREMHPFCLDQGVGVIPWSPLARGLLTRPWGTATTRSATDKFASTLYSQHEDADRAIVAAVADVASRRSVSMAQVSLAWVRQQPAVTAPIVGVTKPQHLDDALHSLTITLTDEEMDALTAAYLPQYPEGF